MAQRRGGQFGRGSRPVDLRCCVTHGPGLIARMTGTSCGLMDETTERLQPLFRKRHGRPEGVRSAAGRAGGTPGGRALGSIGCKKCPRRGRQRRYPSFWRADKARPPCRRVWRNAASPMCWRGGCRRLCPPGHHGLPEQTMGFVFWPISPATRAARAGHGRGDTLTLSPQQKGGLSPQPGSFRRAWRLGGSWLCEWGGWRIIACDGGCSARVPVRDVTFAATLTACYFS